MGGPGEILESEANEPAGHESRLGEPAKQNGGERRARLGRWPSSEAVPERPGEQNFQENRICHESVLGEFLLDAVVMKIPTNGMKPWKARRLRVIGPGNLESTPGFPTASMNVVALCCPKRQAQMTDRTSFDARHGGLRQAKLQSDLPSRFSIAKRSGHLPFPDR